jgi:hypothetical protein
MSLPEAMTISGMDSVAVLEQNLEIARNFRPMEAADGRLERFKTAKELPL